MKNFLLLLPALIISLKASPEPIFDNSDNYLADFDNSPFESGDQIQFAGKNRVINDFQFMYFAHLTNPPTGNEQGRVRFYLNDGPAGTNSLTTPGTLLYDSGFFGLSTNIQTVEISNLSIYVPSDTLTWTVQFSGLGDSERAGALFYDPPGLGKSENFLWENQTNGWTMVVHDGVTNNLAARFSAVPALQILGLTIATNGIAVSSTADSGNTYFLEYQTNVLQSGWLAVDGAFLTAATNVVTFIDTNPDPDPVRIYRVVEQLGGALPVRPRD